MKIQQDDKTIVSMHPTMEARKYKRQLLTHKKGETNGNTAIAGDFKHPMYITGQIIQTQ